MKTIRELKKGEFFTLKPIAEPTGAQVYIRGDYIRADKKYLCEKFSDMCYARLFDGNRIVYTDFTF